MKPQYFPIVYTVINIWRNFGWGSILYLSSMASIDPTLYEAASLDGANRWHKIWHVTLPAIKPTIVVMLIMGVGGMLGADSDMILLLYNPATYDTPTSSAPICTAMAWWAATSATAQRLDL